MESYENNKNNDFKVISGLRNTTLKLGEKLEATCYVIENSSGEVLRVFSGRGLQNVLGFTNTSGNQLQFFLNRESLKTVFQDIGQEYIKKRYSFRRKGAGGAQEKTYGYEATILIEICNKILEAREAGLLSENDKIVAKNAEIIIRSVARVGIIALVDEVTGYEKIREKDELQKLLKAFISEELRPWQKKFPEEFYKQIFRLRNWDYPKAGSERPKIVGKYTNKYIYEELSPEVLEELKRKNPIDSRGNRRYRHHQWLTDNIGNSALEKQIVKIITLMQVSETWEEFEEKFERTKNGKEIKRIENKKTEENLKLF